MTRFGRVSVAFYAAFAVSLVMAQFAGATAAYGKITEGVGPEIGAAVPIALAAVGVFVGILIAYKLVRRMLRA